MSENVKVYSSVVSFSNLLFLVFLGLKLTGVIDWSWLYVNMPLYCGLAIVITKWRQLTGKKKNLRNYSK